MLAIFLPQTPTIFLPQTRTIFLPQAPAILIYETAVKFVLQKTSDISTPNTSYFFYLKMNRLILLQLNSQKLGQLY